MGQGRTDGVWGGGPFLAMPAEELNDTKEQEEDEEEEEDGNYPGHNFYLRPQRPVKSLGSPPTCFAVLGPRATKGPMWGYPRPVIGAVGPLLEPFRGRLSPNIDNVSEKLTLRYPHEGPWVGPTPQEGKKSGI